jgi:mannosyltransferase OCH1-like enzyme
MIYKNIHLIWLGGKLPEGFKSNIERIKKLHPTWCVTMWDDDMVDDLIKSKQNNIYRSFNMFSTAVQKSDIARMVILYHLGGVYMDLDIHLYKPIDSLITKYKHGTDILFRENDPYGYRLLTNSIIYSTKYSPFIKKIYDWVPITNTQIDTGLDIILSTGPAKLTKLYYIYSLHDPHIDVNVNVLGHEHFEPVFLRSKSFDTFDPAKYEHTGAYGLHLYNNSWWDDTIKS